ncbi:ankyrin repeat-containing domain protein [Lactarius hengduanensis]|nr:ankyrin repeat-containing domain protein [Lactarius hengduanensis]
MFRWVYCQLDALRRCLPANIQHALNRLPETLDGTYERTLSDIPEEKWEHAHRLFQCLIASNRPLRVEELAEILAIEFGAEGTANLETGWRLEEAEEAVLSTCSTLIMVVDNADYNYDYGNDNGSRIVQFSHFSVQEFLTSSRLTGSRLNVSRYHVLSGPSHMILARACLSALLRLDDSTDEENILNFSLAMYAANHWHIHALQDSVKSRIQNDIRRLFDLSEPHYAVWTWIRSASYGASRHRMSIRVRPSQLAAPPLFYAATFGLRELVVDLVATRPQDINTTHVLEGPPLLSAVLSGHLEIAKLLIERGAGVSIPDISRRAPLGEMSAKGYLELVKLSLKHGASTEERWTEAGSGALAAALRNGQFDLASFLLDHDVDINALDHQGTTPLHQLTSQFVVHLEGVQWLLEHDADVNARDNSGQTPLIVASHYQPSLVARYSLELRADMKAQAQGWESSNSKDMLEIIRMLLHHGADTRAKDKYGMTPLHKAAFVGEGTEVATLLTTHGADVNAKAEDLQTPLHLASRRGNLGAVELLVEHGADISARTKARETPLHVTAKSADIRIVRFLVGRGADVNSRTDDLRTPLHLVSECPDYNLNKELIRSKRKVIHLLITHGANVGARDGQSQTPFGLALACGCHDTAQLLLEHWHLAVTKGDSSDSIPEPPGPNLCGDVTPHPSMHKLITGSPETTD